MSLLGQKSKKQPETPGLPSVSTDMFNDEAEPFNDFIKNVRKTEAKMAEESVAKQKEEVAAAKQAEEDALKDPWHKKVYEICQTLSLEDFIFEGHTEAEIETIPGALWITYRSTAHDVINGLMAQALKDTSGEPIVVYENHYAMLMLTESIVSIRSAKGNFPLPMLKEEKYSKIQSLDSNLVRKIIDNHNIFDAAVARMLNVGVVDELKK